MNTESQQQIAQKAWDAIIKRQQGVPARIDFDCIAIILSAIEQATEEDRKRLDWLENEPADVIFTFKKSEGRKFFVTNFNGKQSDKPNLREAIDEAMKTV